MDLKMVASHHSPQQPYESCCMLDDRFLLLGHVVHGVQFLDFAYPVEPRTIIWLRARHMVLIESCRLVLMIAGRNKRVRCYSLDALLRLCYALSNADWSKRTHPEYNVPSLELWQKLGASNPIAKNSNNNSGNDNDNNNTSVNGGDNDVHFGDGGKDTQSSLSTNHLTLVNKNNIGLAKPCYFCNGVALQNYYYKLPEGKDVLSIQTYQTSAYLFVAMHMQNKVVVWQRRRDTLLRPFHKLKEFWLPTEPRSISFADDRATLKYLVAVFSSEATVIGLQDSIVRTVPIDKKWEELHHRMALRDQLLAQQQRVHHDSNNSNNINIHSNYRFRSHSSPQLFQPISMQWTSLIQLPFYPDSIPTTLLTTDFSNPPTYDTVISSSPNIASDPVGLSSAIAPQLFFATLGRHSYIVDLSGALFSTMVYSWSVEPSHVEFICLDGEWCAVGFAAENVELINMRSSKSVHPLMHGVPVRFLGRWDVGKKCKALFWSCLVLNKTLVYKLESSGSISARDQDNV